MAVIYPLPSKRPPQIAPRVNAAEAFPPELLQVEGLLDQFMTECHASAPERRQPVYALATGLSLIGALAGRRYRSETNLRTNIYSAILGESSSGKGHAPRVALRLLHDAGLGRYVAADYQSGAALLTELVEHPARFSVIDEFGIWIAALTGDRAPKHIVDIKRHLMTLFSSAGDIVAGGGYANKSERARHDITQPHLCLVGTGTPDHFFRALQSGALRDGFIPRFLVFKPDHYFPPLVETPRPIEISPDMVLAAQRIAGASPEDGNLAGLLPMQHDIDAGAALVPFTTDGRAEHGRHRQRREGIIQGGCLGFCSGELVGKWGEHAIKLAMVRAISRDPAQPVLDQVVVSWGWRVAEHCIRTINAMAERNLADNRTESENKRVRNLISDAGPDGIVKHDLIQRTRFLDIKQRDMILASLIDSGEITAHQIPPGATGGRPGYRFKMAA